MKRKIRVVNTHKRSNGSSRERVLFSGSEAAFEIWSTVHFVPPTAEKRQVISERMKHVGTELVYENGQKVVPYQ